jgi:type I restriction enzyme M protein
MNIDIARISNEFWNCADLLRGKLNKQEVMDIVLSLLMLKRFDAEILKQNFEIGNVYKTLEKQDKIIDEIEGFIFNKYNCKYFNHSAIRFSELLRDDTKIKENLMAYLNSFSSNIKEIFDEKHLNLLFFINKLSDDNQRLYSLIEQINRIDIRNADTQDIGNIFEELLRRFSNEGAKDAGEFYTPRDVVRLLVKILTTNLQSINRRTVYDCACGTGGILTGCYREMKGKVAEIELYGQELNGGTFAIAKGEMLMQGINGEIVEGNTLLNDKLQKRFDYIGANPPFGVKWENEAGRIDKNEDRYKHGLPSKDDGQLLFDMTCLMKLNDDGRAVIIHNLSPLFKDLWAVENRKFVNTF